MSDDAIDVHAPVRPSVRPGESRARRGHGLKAQLFKVKGASDVPRVGNDEASLCMQLAKAGALLVEGSGQGLFLSLNEPRFSGFAV
jgi:hypothetical protein